MTRELQQAIKDGYSAEFCRLLMNYGIWSRYFGCTGYKSHHEGVMAVIDDDTALQIDKAVLALKRARPNLYMLFRMSRINSLSEYAIMNEIKYNTHNKFCLDAEIKRYVKYLNAQAVRDLIVHAEKMLLNILEEQLREELCR